ncbi:MAG: Obg family GTPase CgtA, partial [bacterium]|nr:Obg family GTPase CgtA [bacterium]
ELYSADLLHRPVVVALNKADVAPADLKDQVRDALSEKGYPVHVISAATGEGVRSLVYHLAELLDSIPPPAAPVENMVVIRAPRQDERAWTVAQTAEHEFTVQGRGIERLVKMTDLENEEAVRRLHRKLERIGVLQRLREAGIQHGDTVRIGNEEFDFVDEDRWEAS